MKGTEEASGSGSGLTSLAKTLPPCLIILRRVARPIPEDAPRRSQNVKAGDALIVEPVMMTTWSLMWSSSLSEIVKLVMIVSEGVESTINMSTTLVDQVVQLNVFQST